MSLQQLALAWKVRGLTPVTKLVLMELADASNPFGQNSFRSERTIADACECSLRSVRTSLQTLIEKGLISVQEDPTPRRSTTYQLHLRGGKSLPLSGRQSLPLREAGREAIREANGDIPPTPPYKEEPLNQENQRYHSLLVKWAAQTLRAMPATASAEAQLEAVIYKLRQHRITCSPADAVTVMRDARQLLLDERTPDVHSQSR